MKQQAKSSMKHSNKSLPAHRFFNSWEDRSLDKVCAAINAQRLEMAGLYEAPYNVYRPWVYTYRMVEYAESCVDYHDPYFYRYWLDQFVLWEGYTVWNHVVENELRLLTEQGVKRDLHKKADRKADEVLARFEDNFR
jgi:hypothetical protein